jgi:hypothetical protein
MRERPQRVWTSCLCPSPAALPSRSPRTRAAPRCRYRSDVASWVTIACGTTSVVRMRAVTTSRLAQPNPTTTGAWYPGTLTANAPPAPSLGVVKKTKPKATSKLAPKTTSRRSPRTMPSKLRSSQSGVSSTASGVEAIAPRLHAARPTRDGVPRGAVESEMNNNQRPIYVRRRGEHLHTGGAGRRRPRRTGPRAHRCARDGGSAAVRTWRPTTLRSRWPPSCRPAARR